jgi:hypothetical protein
MCVSGATHKNVLRGNSLFVQHQMTEVDFKVNVKVICLIEEKKETS